MRINTNISAMNTYSRLTAANTAKSGSLAKLSSGLRINKAGDDAAGLAISEKMKNQVSGMTQASRNAQDGISLIQTAEGALKETHSILNRMRDLTVQASNDTNTDDDRKAIQAEIESLTAEVDRISSDTEFNTKGLMNGEFDISDTELNKIVTEYNKGVGVKIGISNKYATPATPTDTENNKVLTQLQEMKSSEKNELLEIYNSQVTEGSKVNTFAELEVKFGSTTDGANFTAHADKAKVETAIDTYNKKFEIENSDLRHASKLDQDNLTAALTAAAAKDLEGNLINSTDQLETNGDSKFTFQIGANAGEQISVKIGNMSGKGLGIDGIDVSKANLNNSNTDDILKTLDKAIASVSTQRAELGATQNRLDHTVSNLTTTKENLSEANSRIVDVDMAEEMMSFTKSNILSQAATSMLAQANQMPQGVLQLLQ